MKRLSLHFTLEELDCKCGCETPPAILAELEKTAAFLERVRSFLGDRPITVNSGYRCPKRNAEVGGARNSYHVRGFAADITVSGLTPAQVQRRLEEPGSPVARSGKGSYRTFTHVDRRRGRARWVG